MKDPYAVRPVRSGGKYERHGMPHLCLFYPRWLSRVESERGVAAGVTVRAKRHNQQAAPAKWPFTAEDTGRASQPLPVNIRLMAPRFVQTNPLLNETR